MKALVCTTPGKLDYLEKGTPTLTAGRAVVRIRRIGICGTDLHAFEGSQPYFSYPRILGHELAGELAAIDPAGDFTTGEAVTVIPYFYCGHCVACRKGKTNCCVTINVCGVHIDGGMAEYLEVPAYSLVHGKELRYDELALVEPLAIGAHAVRRAAIEKNDFVLVVGAGPIGLGIMEFARIAGARVIAMDVNKDRLAFCREKIFVDFTVDASEKKQADAIREITDGDWPAVVFDATGNVRAIEDAFDYVSHGGKYILVGLQKGDICFSHPEFHKREATLMSSRNATREDFEHVIRCIEKGIINPLSYITHRTSFDRVGDEFASWIDPSSGVIKAMVEVV